MFQIYRTTFAHAKVEHDPVFFFPIVDTFPSAVNCVVSSRTGDVNHGSDLKLAVISLKPSVNSDKGGNPNALQQLCRYSSFSIVDIPVATNILANR